MLQEIVLHIGTPKTGTTALQLAMSRQRSALIKAGIYFPAASLLAEPGVPVNLQDLTLYAADPSRPLALRARRSARFRDPEEYRAAVRQGLATICGEASAAGCKRLLLSAEGLYARLSSEAELACLHGLLAPWAESFRILVWFRRQDEYFLSRVSQAAKLGTFTVAEACRYDDAYDYSSRVLLWEKVFVGAAVSAVPYRRDTLADFHRVMNLPDRLLSGEPGEINLSLSAESIALVAAMESRLLKPPAGGRQARAAAEFRMLVRRTDQERSRTRLDLALAARQRLMATCEAQNRQLADRYNGGRPFFDLADLGSGWADGQHFAKGDNLATSLNLPALDSSALRAWFGRIPEFTAPRGAAP